MTGPDGFLDKRPDLAALAATICFLMIAGFIGFKYHNSVEIDSGEHDGYFLIAKEIIKEHSYADTYRPPFYSLLTAAVSLVSSTDTFVSGKLVSLFWGGLLVFFLYKLGDLLFGKQAALLAQLFLLTLFPVYNFAVWNSPSVMLASLFLIILFYLASYVDRGISKKEAAFLGVLFGLAYLTKYTALALLPAVIFCFFSGKKDFRAALSAFSLFFLCFTGFILPWLLYNNAVHGSPFFNDNWRNLALALYGKGSYRYLSGNPFDGWASVIANDPLLFIKHWYTNVLNFFRQDLLFHAGGSMFGAFAVAGIVSSIKRESRKIAVILIFMIVYALGALMIFYRARIMLIFTPLLVLFGCSFIFQESFPENVALPFTGKFPFRKLVVILFLSANINMFRYDLHHFKERHPVLELEGGKWIQNTGSAVLKVATTLPFSGWYFDFHSIYLPDATGSYKKEYIKQVEREIIKEKPDYLLVGERTLRSRPHDLFQLDRYNKSFKTVYEIKSPYHMKVFSFR